MSKFFLVQFLTEKFFLAQFHSKLTGKGFFSSKLKYKIENRLIFSPRIKKVLKIQKELIGTFTPIKLLTPDCVRLYAWYVKPKENNPVVIFIPGQSESISKWQDTLIFLQNIGYGALFLSLRGHYKSAGIPSEEGVYTDAETAIKFLKKEGYKNKDIIVWGRSLGTATALEMGVRHKLRGVILESAIQNIKQAASTLIEYYLTAFKISFFKNYVKQMLSKLEFIQNFENDKKIVDLKTKTLIIHSKNDLKIPYKTAELLHSLNPKTKLVICDDGSHETNEWCFKEIKNFFHSLSEVTAK